MDRETMLVEVSRRLDRRRLVWFGTRGDDVLSLSDLPELAASFSLISPLTSLSSVPGYALEELTGRRVDLDTFDVDDVIDEPIVRSFREQMLRELSGPSALFEYRPTAFSSSVAFARRDRCLHLGLFTGHQSAFEHKPWLETSIADLGIPHIPWTYIADIDQLDAVRLLDSGPVVLRRSRSSGGVGLVRAEDRAQLEQRWPEDPEAYVSVAPFLSGGLPLNVGAVVWADGVTVHHASVQIIGEPCLTAREFGYCGNDFAGAADLGSEVLGVVDRSTRRIGDWLRSRGYRGAYGVDFLLVDGVPLFTEVNPRFQGSTYASCRLSVAAGSACLLLEHLASFLDVPTPASPTLADRMVGLPAMANVVVHNLDQAGVVDPARIVDAASGSGSLLGVDVLATSGLVVDSGAAVARLTLADRVLDGRGRLRSDWKDRLTAVRSFASPAGGLEGSAG